MNTNPTIVLCQGAWHQPAHYLGLTNALTQAGFKVRCPPLPSCSGARPPTASLKDDVSTISKLLTSLVEKGDAILILMHSYGGTVGTNATDPKLSAAERTKHGLSGGILGLFYMCAFLLQPGETVQSASTTMVLERDPVVVAEDLSSSVGDPRFLFYNDLDAATAEENLKLLKTNNVRSFTEPVTETPWMVIPSAYLYCEDDKMLWHRLQIEFLRVVKEKGGIVHEETLNCGHCPFLSKRDEVVAAVVRASNAWTAGMQ